MNVLTGQLQTRDEQLCELMKTANLMRVMIEYRTQHAALSAKLVDRYKAEERADNEAFLDEDEPDVRYRDTHEKRTLLTNNP